MAGSTLGWQPCFSAIQQAILQHWEVTQLNPDLSMQDFFAPRRRKLDTDAGCIPQRTMKAAQLDSMQQANTEEQQQPTELAPKNLREAGTWVSTLPTTVTTHSQPALLTISPVSSSKGFTQGKPGLFTLPGDGEAVIGYWPRHVRNAGEVFTELMQVTPWEQHRVVVYGQEYDQPRLVAYYALDTSQSYTYSGLTLKPLEFTPLLYRLLGVVQALCGGDQFNTVLLNLYRDGKDSNGWHSDDEAVYAARSTIASLSLGAEREFLMRSKADHGVGLRFSLGAGDALVMCGTTQMGWQHSVPKRSPPNKYAPRINLTFRQAVQTSTAGSPLKKLKPG